MLPRRFANILCLVPLIICIFSCREKEPIMDVMDRMNISADTLQNAAYKIDYRVKYFTSEDTFHAPAYVWVKKMPEDTLFGMHLRLSMINGREYIYDGTRLSVIDHQDSVVIIDDPHAHGTGLITGNMSEDLIFDAMLFGLNTDQLAEDSVDIAWAKKWDTESHVTIRMSYPEHEDFKDSYRWIHVNRNSYMAENMIFVARWQDMHQYNEWLTSELQINQPGIPDSIYGREPPPSYRLEYHSVPKKKEDLTLKAGETPPALSLIDLSGKIYELTDLAGSVVVLDFWYMSCYPCVKALPHLQALHQKYKDKGLVVLGVNAHDNNKRKSKLPEFLLKRDITYPTLLSKPAVDAAFGVQAYPTLYVVNKAGQIGLAQVGFSKEIMAELDDEIQRMLVE